MLTTSLLCLMFALELGGTDGWAWDSAGTIGLLVAAAAGLILFLFAEVKAKDPIVPLGLFKDRVFTEQPGHWLPIWRRDDRGSHVYSAFRSGCFP